MRRILSLILVVGLATSQAWALACPMDSADGRAVDGVAVHEPHDHHAHNPSRAPAPEPASGHETHTGGLECKLVMACGAAALPSLVAGNEPPARLASAALASPTDVPASIHFTAEPPPPRLHV